MLTAARLWRARTLHVMPAPVAGIHVLLPQCKQDVDGRDKPGHDEASVARTAIALFS